MKNIKILCSIFLIAAMMLSILVSCGKSDESENTGGDVNAEEVGGVEEEVTEEVIQANLPAADYGGYEFVVVSRNDDWHFYPLHSRDIIAEDETGEPINDAVYKRNTTVEEMYNIKISMVSFPETTGEGEMAPNNALVKAVKAGDFLYDLIMVHEINGGTTAQQGYFYNWFEVPVIDLEKPWWCKGATDGLSVENKLFLALSDFSVSSNDHCYTVLFNKQLQADFQVENLYELVKTNQWTFDKMYSLVKDVYIDFNGDGAVDKEDVFGLIAGGGQLNFFNAGDNYVTKKDHTNRPYIDMPTERMITTFEKAFEIINGPHTYSFTSWIDEAIVPMFSANKSLLMTTQVGIIQQLRNMDVDFGILPYPKLDSSQEKYLNYVDGHAQLMGIPVNTPNLERSGTIIEALSYYAYLYQVPAYYDVNLKTKHARDEESAEMLNHIFDGRVFDFGYVYDNWVIAFKFGDLINSKSDTFVSTIEKTLASAEKNLAKILAAYDEIQ